MDTLVTRILELSSSEADLPVDVVDLGTCSDSTTHPSKLTPKNTYTDTYTNGGSYESNGHSRVSNFNGLQASKHLMSKPEPQRTSCC